MDKNKNRTDLLAAGRKKLQQFRQKKDTKGNSSKSSGKAANSGLDASANAANKVVATSQKVVDSERSVHDAEDHIPSSESHSTVNSREIDTVAAPDDLSTKENATESSLSLPIGFSPHLERKHGEEQEVASPGEIQVDAARLMQLDSESRVSSNEFGESAGDHLILDSQSVEVAEATQVATQLELDDASSSAVANNTAEDDQGFSVVGNKTAEEDQGRDGTQSLPDLEGTSTVSEVTAMQREDILSSLSKGEKTEMHFVSHDDAESTQVNFGITDADRPLKFNTNGVEKSLRPKMVDLSRGSDGCLISLSRLAEILRGLDEDEFRFLFMSRESSTEIFRNTDSMKVPESVVYDAFERLKEQLYLASFARDAFYLHLSEHQHLLDEITMASASHNEVQGKNEVLAEELAQCRYELQGVVSQREELEKQLHFSKYEVEDLSAKVNKLQNELETTQRDLSCLTSELVDCRNLVATLHAENEDLIENSDLMTKEKKKLLEENELIVLENDKVTKELVQCQDSLESHRLENVDLTENLASLTEERRKLEQDKESIVHKNEKLLADLSNCMSMAEALQVENKNLNENLMSGPEKRKMLEDERDLTLHENEKRAKELMDNKDLVAALQAEISHLNGVLMSTMTDKNKIEEEKETKVSENEKQSHSLTEIKASVSVLHEECSKAVDDYPYPLPASGQSEVLLFDCQANRPYLEGLKLDAFDDSFRFVVMKRHLEDAGDVLQKLEKAIEGMHFHSTSLSGSSGKVVSPGVSKLIQAFESKSQTDDHDSEDLCPSKNQTGDPYMITEQVTQNMKAVLKELTMDAENASEFCREVKKSKLLSDAAATGLRSDYESLREHSDHLEEANVELMVLYESTREHVHHAVAREGELVASCDALQKQDLILKSENNELREKLGNFQAKISEIQSQLEEICRSSNETAASQSNEVKTLQKEVVDRESILEEEWSSSVARVIQTVGELDATVEPLCSTALADANSLDVVSRVAISVDAATKLICGLQEQLEASHKDHQSLLDTYNDMRQKCNNLQGENEIIKNALQRLYGDLHKLVSEASGYMDETENAWLNHELLDLLHPGVFDNLLEQLNTFLGERLQLQYAHTELMNRARDIDELERKCIQSDAILKLVEDIERSVRLEGMETCSDEPASHLESLIYLLVEQYKEAAESLSLSREETSSLEMQLSDLREQMEHSNFVLVQCENENLVFKQSLKSAEEDVVSLSFKLQEKVAELEKSEQRVASLREKLSIAVTKGKGLISQRESLKQSLAETSKELEKCSQELLSKDARLRELETKLKSYSEAGERMEALESELSYIRNSATVLRESFLLKDSVLQRIEEILEDLELPEHFHSRDVIEKIDWLAKSVTENSLPPPDWDPRSSVGGGSYSDAGFVDMDGLKEDIQPNLNSSDDLRRRFEELQSRFYGLAVQNEMLEQSLMERNNLVQRWEEILDRVDMPSQLRSMEPDDKIQWLESALSESQNQCNSLQQKIDNLETFCGSLTADLEETQRRILELDSAFQQASREKGILSRDLEILTHDYDEISKKAADFEINNGNLNIQLSLLQEKLEQKPRVEEDIHLVEGAIRRLQGLVKNVLQDSSTEDMIFGQDGTEYLEALLMKLIEKYKTLTLGKPINSDAADAHGAEEVESSHIARDTNEQDAVILSKKLEDSMAELICLKQQKDEYVQNNQSLVRDIEALEMKKNELQELLNQEEQKSSSLREKLNVAVRKGKSLVQQRDGMKQMIEELTAEVERLKSEININKKSILKYEQRIKDLSINQEMVQGIESENMFLRDHLAETKHYLQEKESSLSMILESLDDIAVGLAINFGNPVEKLKEIGKHCHGLRTVLDSAEQESRKSKRAAELLLAELNEVQERNDGLQEELAQAASELSELSKEKDLAEAAKHEALTHIEKLSAIHSEEKDRQLSEVTVLQSVMDQLREELFAIDNVLGNVLSNDLEVLQNAEATMKSFLELGDIPDVSVQFTDSSHGGSLAMKSENKVFMPEIVSLKERLYNHPQLLHKEKCRLSEVAKTVHREISSQSQELESMKRSVEHFESIEKEKGSELFTMRRNISLLYEACTNAILEIENLKTQLVGNGLVSGTLERQFTSQILVGGGDDLTGDTPSFTEEGIKEMRDKLLYVVKDFTSMQTDILEVSQKEMKDTIFNLRKELQEKDIERDRMCMELVSQIKEAEANARNYLQDLQSARAQLHDLQRQVDVKEEKHRVLEQRMTEIQDWEATSVDLQQKVKSLTDALAAKEQETEALMQALDEEEAQMEDLTNRVGELERKLQQKNDHLENLEVSRGKALKKLSVTVSKFDELHYLSESLLSEVEKLQSQLQERDGEISFLRQEVTRCTNDALAVTQMKKRSSVEIHDFLTWLDTLISRVLVKDINSDHTRSDQINERKETLQKQIMSFVTELENLRVVTQNSDMLLQEARGKVEELTRRERYLENSLHEKESQLSMFQGAGDAERASNTSSEIMEIEQVMNKWTTPATIASQVRSLRKTNSDQVAVAIDMNPSIDRLEVVDDDKAHGFKSLTASRLVPRFTRPVTDMVDGLWVSCDRALMRQPALRLGVIIYWAVMHTLLATFAV